MDREQHVVARDFLGLGKVGENSSTQHHSDLHGRLSPNQMEMLHKLHATATGDAGLNCRSTLFNTAVFPGMKHQLWNKAAVIQRLLPFRDFHDERFIEQSAESVPEGSYQHDNQLNSLPNQVALQGNFSITSSPTREDCVPSSHAGVLGMVEKSMPRPRGETSAHVSLPETRMASNGVMEKHANAPLTIFYGGNVNIFNDVSAEKAHAIMLLAGIGNAHNTPAGLFSPPVANLPDQSQMNVRNGQSLMNCDATANQVNYPAANMQFNFAHPTSSVPSSPLPTGQPVVPRALPQARKASLTRFLEKRRERLQSKSPYALVQDDSSLPEERLSSSNDIFAYKSSKNVDIKKKPPASTWMEMMSENFASDTM